MFSVQGHWAGKVLPVLHKCSWFLSRNKKVEKESAYTNYKVFFKGLETKHFFKYGLEYIQENYFVIFFFFTLWYVIIL
jgi:hypothetical protein